MSETEYNLSCYLFPPPNSVTGLGTTEAVGTLVHGLHSPIGTRCNTCISTPAYGLQCFAPLHQPLEERSDMHVRPAIAFRRPSQRKATQPHHCAAAPPSAAAGAGASSAPHVFGRGSRIGNCRIHLFAAHFDPFITGLPQCSVRLSGFSLRKHAAAMRVSSRPIDPSEWF